MAQSVVLDTDCVNQDCCQDAYHCMLGCSQGAHCAADAGSLDTAFVA